ncbi:MAG: sensor histidine kinase [Clostridia bacterium]|jgi:two-component system sensor histidine kinase KdpD|nr:sensor histidine kinase [Clostridia bacterium]
MKGKDYLSISFIIIGTMVSSMVLSQLEVDKENILMVFMVGVLLVTAFTRGYLFGIIASCISVAVFNYFFTEPLHTFAMNDSNDIALMFFFLIASVISSSLTARFQRQLTISQKNEQTAKLLYELTQRLLNVTGEYNIVHQGIQCIKEYTGYDSIVELDERHQIYRSDNFIPSDTERSMELPIMGIAKSIGTLKVYDKNENLNMEQEWLVNALAAQIGIALDREFVYNERENTRIAMEREHLKSNLLRSIGHDLRTPLAGIAGASSYIMQKYESLDRESIESLAGDINEQAVWLTTLVENILNMTRIENDKLEVNKQVEVIDDVVSDAVTHVVGLSKRPFKITLPKEVITVPMDGKMIVQVLVNLLDNAVKHTSKNCPIELFIHLKDGYVEFNIADGGMGTENNSSIHENLFDAFVTSGKTGADGKKGIGLGLAICKAVVKAHGGSISTGKSHLGGALFTFTIPYMEAE